MQAMAGELPQAERSGEGLRFAAGDGWVYIAPLERRCSLRVVGESFDAETAEELCSIFARRAKELDARLREGQKVGGDKG